MQGQGRKFLRHFSLNAILGHKYHQNHLNRVIFSESYEANIYNKGAFDYSLYVNMMGESSVQDPAIVSVPTSALRHVACTVTQKLDLDQSLTGACIRSLTDTNLLKLTFCCKKSGFTRFVSFRRTLFE